MNVLLTARACSSWIAVTAACIMLIAGLDVHAQVLRIGAANSSNTDVYDVNFENGAIPGGSVSSLITDQNTRTELVSMVFLRNPFAVVDGEEAGTLVLTAAVDIVAADKNEIVIWPGPTSTERAVGVVLWAQGDEVAGPNPLILPGPVAPNGLSLDSAENLYVTSSTPGASVDASLWVFPRNPDALSPPVNLANPPPPFLSPRLVDSDFGGRNIRLLEETTVSGVTVDLIGVIELEVDDLLVVASDPASVFLYKALDTVNGNDIASVLAGGVEIDPTLVLISPEEFLAEDGAVPTGIAFWPPDNSLLISTGSGDGDILQKNLATARFEFFDPPFASDLGPGD